MVIFSFSTAESAADAEDNPTFLYRGSSSVAKENIGVSSDLYAWEVLPCVLSPQVLPQFGLQFNLHLTDSMSHFPFSPMIKIQEKVLGNRYHL